VYHTHSLSPSIVLVAIIVLLGVFCSAVAADKPRVVVLTDIAGDPDDQQSLVRFLLYSNEFDVEGLVASTSCWKYEHPNVGVIHDVIDAYEKVYPNLIRHDSNYPAPGKLREVTKSGVDAFGMAAAFVQSDNEAVRHIISVIDKKDPRPVWFVVWGGGNTLGAAVAKVKSERTPADAKAFVDKIRGYEIALQDDAFAYIMKNFPDAKLISAELLWKGISRTTPTFNQWPESWGGNDDIFNASWVRENVQTNHGALGEAYPDGIFLFEGDSPSFLYLIPNGLNCPDHVDYGGWGGRFDAVRKLNVQSGTGHDGMDASLEHYRDYALYSDAKDSWSYGATNYDNVYATVFRWREAFQADFAARMDWCVKSFTDANHQPIAVVNGDQSQSPIYITGAPEAVVTLDASASSDPDKDELSYSWWVYEEPGSYRGNIVLEDPESAAPRIKIPKDASGMTFHVILTLSDNASPKLTSYRRIVVSVTLN